MSRVHCQSLQKHELRLKNCSSHHDGEDDCLRTYFLYFPTIVCDKGQQARRRQQRQQQRQRQQRQLNHVNQVNQVNHVIQEKEGQEEEEEGRTFDKLSNHWHAANHTNNVVARRTSVYLDENAYHRVGTLPMVFAVHCFGCEIMTMAHFIPQAEARNQVLVIPKGLHESFNGKHCCGYAVTANVNDVDFFRQLQLHLQSQYSFLQAGVSYGVGYSNGGFMVTHAALEGGLFRGVAPIAGHTYEFDTSSNTEVGSMGKHGIALFLHHSLDDAKVRPSGCCPDPQKPECCCGISKFSTTCVPLLQVFHSWAKRINRCYDPHGFSDANGSYLHAQPKNVHLNTQRGVTCQTILSPQDLLNGTTGNAGRNYGGGCLANTTLCMYNHSGHFEPSLASAFPMTGEVMDFFARDACDIRGGVWESMGGNYHGPFGGKCSCPDDLSKGQDLYGGTYCLDKILKSADVPWSFQDDSAKLSSLLSPSSSTTLKSTSLPTPSPTPPPTPPPTSSPTSSLTPTPTPPPTPSPTPSPTASQIETSSTVTLTTPNIPSSDSQTTPNIAPSNTSDIAPSNTSDNKHHDQSWILLLSIPLIYFLFYRHKKQRRKIHPKKKDDQIVEDTLDIHSNNNDPNTNTSSNQTLDMDLAASHNHNDDDYETRQRRLSHTNNLQEMVSLMGKNENQNIFDLNQRVWI